MGDEVVYLLQGGPYCKIGRSKDVLKRLKEFQTSHPYRLTVVRTWETDAAAALERYLHRRFQAFKMSGEWFQFPPDELDIIVKTETWTIEPFEEPVFALTSVPLVEQAGITSIYELCAVLGIYRPIDLARRAGISKAYAHLLWTGKRLVGRKLAKKLAPVFQMSPESLIMMEPPPKRLSHHTPPDTPAEEP